MEVGLDGSELEGEDLSGGGQAWRRGSAGSRGSPRRRPGRARCSRGGPVARAPRSSAGARRCGAATAWALSASVGEADRHLAAEDRGDVVLEREHVDQEHLAALRQGDDLAADLGCCRRAGRARHRRCGSGPRRRPAPLRPPSRRRRGGRAPRPGRAEWNGPSSESAPELESLAADRRPRARGARPWRCGRSRRRARRGGEEREERAIGAHPAPAARIARSRTRWTSSRPSAFRMTWPWSSVRMSTSSMVDGNRKGAATLEHWLPSKASASQRSKAVTPHPRPESERTEACLPPRSESSTDAA